MHQRRVIILTDPKNNITEDATVAQFLEREGFSPRLHDYRKGFECSPSDIVMIGRTWPSEDEDHEPYQEWKRNLIESERLPESSRLFYNTLDGQGDRLGKGHLVRLYEERAELGILGSHLIPTTLLKEGMALGFPEHDLYLIKPIDGLSSLGSSVATRANFLALSEKLGEEFSSSVSGFVVQPFLTIEKEISFCFVDSELQYCLDFPPKIPEWQPPVPYAPSREEEEIARSFIRWNGMTSGITRLDFAKTRKGGLYLLEIEDFNPYLSLPDIPDRLQERILRAISDSLGKFIDDLPR